MRDKIFDAIENRNRKFNSTKTRRQIIKGSKLSPNEYDSTSSEKTSRTNLDELN